MKRNIAQWMPLITSVLLVAVPLVLLGLKLHWLWTPITGWPMPLPLLLPS